LPQPFFDSNLRQRLVLPFILVGNPGGDAAFADYLILAGWSHRF